MKLTQELKLKIDSMSYYTMLSQWRFAPSGTELFQDESGEYFQKVMCEKQDANPSEAVSASKDIGW